ncbi:MAG: hypothetical protein R3B84_22840 [Zavarzinella sp.]
MKTLLQTIGLLLVAWIIGLFAGRSGLFSDPGTFWHIETGRLIADSGFFGTDPFTYSHTEKPWLPHQWLGEYGMHQINAWAGFDGLLMVTVALLVALFAVPLLRLWQRGWHPLFCVVLALLAIAACAANFHVRPTVITMMGMAYTFFILHLWDQRKISGGMYMFGTWIVFAIWANCHGGVLGGVATLGLATVLWTACGIWQIGKDPNSRYRLEVLWVTLLGTFVALIATPYGWSIAKVWLQIYQMQSLTTIIQEHAPLKLFSATGFLTMLLMAVYLALLASIPRNKQRVLWWLPLAWLLLTWTRIRHAPLFTLGVLIYLPGMLESSRWLPWFAKPERDYFRPRSTVPTLRSLLLSVGVFLGTVLVGIQLKTSLLGNEARIARLDLKRWPSDLLPVLRAAEPADTTRAIFNELELGGFIAHFTPRLKTFCDDRCELFGDQFLWDYVKYRDGLLTGAVSPRQAMQEWIEPFGKFDIAIVQNEGGFDRMFRVLGWKPIRGQHHTIYTRN